MQSLQCAIDAVWLPGGRHQSSQSAFCLSAAAPNPFYVKAQFSLLAPGAHVRPHTGPTNERLAISLCLGGCGADTQIRVGTAWRRWTEGEALVFDDSFEHEVRVAGGDDAPPRAVAIFHVAHPQLIARNHSKSNAAIVARRMRDAADEVCEHDGGPPE